MILILIHRIFKSQFHLGPDTVKYSTLKYQTPHTLSIDSSLSPQSVVFLYSFMGFCVLSDLHYFEVWSVMSKKTKMGLHRDAEIDESILEPAVKEPALGLFLDFVLKIVIIT